MLEIRQGFTIFAVDKDFTKGEVESLKLTQSILPRGSKFAGYYSFTEL